MTWRIGITKLFVVVNVMPLSRSSSVPSSSTTHPFQNATGLLVVIPDKIDVEEESRFYDQLCDVRMPRILDKTEPDKDPELQEPDGRASRASIHRSQGPPSVFSHDIWLGDNSGESRAFARDVHISGWTNVGDKLGGAYVGTCLPPFCVIGSC